MKKSSEKRIEVWYKKEVFDAAARGLLGDIADLGIKDVKRVEIGFLFLIRSRLTEAVLRKVARQLLSDPVTQRFWLGKRPKPSGVKSVEVWYKEGVTDTVGETALKGIKDLGLDDAEKVSTGKRYFLYGKDLSREATETIARRLLANEVVQFFKIE